MSLFVNYVEHDSTLRKSGTFWFGKYKDLAVASILESEPSYIIWIADNIPADKVTIDPDLLQEANELYDTANNNGYIESQNDAAKTTDDWWNWK